MLRTKLRATARSAIVPALVELAVACVAGAATLDNVHLAVTVEPGAAGPVIVGRSGANPPRVELTLVPSGNITKAEAAGSDDSEKVLRFTAQGPCEYVLDVEGVKPRPRGGDRELLEVALCPLFDNRIYPLVVKRQRGQELTDKDETTVAQVCEDMKAFTRGVLGRIREYERFAHELTLLCADHAAKTPKLQPLCENIAETAQGMLKEIGRLDSTTFDCTMTREKKRGVKELLAYWDEQLTALPEEVKADKYERLARLGNIKAYGDFSDPIVAKCRMAVKSIRQDAALADSSDPQVAAFAAKIREMCRQIMRHKHPKEGL